MIKWIDSKKELPEYDARVLVCTDNGEYAIAEWCKCDDGMWRMFPVRNYWRHEQIIHCHWAHINAPEIGGGHHG